MADGGYMDRGRRRKKRGTRREWQERDAPYEREDDPHSQPPTKHPIILAKPNRPISRDSPGLSDDQTAYSPKSEDGSEMVKSMTVLRSNEPYSAQSIPTMLAGDSHQAYQVQRRPTTSAGPHNEGPDRLSLSESMDHCVKLVDEDLLWCEAGSVALQDQTDFSVIGAIGLQGSGKSTILSHLAGVLPHVFDPQSRTVREVCSHQTAGIDLHLSEERTIFLDSQPVLSASVLDQMIQHDIKHHGEYSTVENCMEMQSLQLASFLFTVCNIVIVVMEGFSDFNVFRFLQTAEMLKPQTPQPHDSPSEGLSEIYPHIVFVVNHANAEDFKAGSYEKMQMVIARLMSQSNLKFKGLCNMRDLIPGLSSSSPHSDVNLYLLPEKSAAVEESDDPLSMQYCGYPTFEFIIEALTKKLLAMPRHLLTHTTLSEKNWLHYAARSWDSVKKSGLISEYNRLLP